MSVYECPGHEAPQSIFLDNFPHHHDGTLASGFAACAGVGCLYCDAGAEFYARCDPHGRCAVTGHRHLPTTATVKRPRRPPRRQRRAKTLWHDDETGATY